MTGLMQVRLGIAAIGVLVWAYGVRVEDRRLGLAGIIMLAVALAMRFLGRRGTSRSDPEA